MRGDLEVARRAPVHGGSVKSEDADRQHHGWAAAFAAFDKLILAATSPAAPIGVRR